MLNLDVTTITETATIGAKMSEFKPTLSEGEKAVARALYLALKPFLAERPTMPAQYIMTYLQVAMEEGLGVSEYASKADVAPTVMTRHLLDIGDRNRVGEDGFGWITQERDRNDLRRHHARITPKGKALLNQVKQALASAAHALR